MDGNTIKFQIWDTAGQEKYRGLAPMYYRGAHAAIVVYEITDAKSLDGVKEWIEQLKENGPADCVLTLAGNKVLNCHVGRTLR